MSEPAADTSAAQDSLVLASMASPVEMELITAWVERQRADHPGTRVDVLRLPEPDAPPSELSALAQQLESGDDRSIVPVQVFWLPPPDRSRLAKVAGLLPGLDRADANPWVTVAVATGMGELRNGLVVRASDALIAIGGGPGTLSEIGFALKVGRPVVGLGTWELARGGVGDASIVVAGTPGEAVERALGLARG